MRKEKSSRDSESTLSQIVLNNHINGYGRLFGGQLMAWVDVLAGVVARRHSEEEVTTLGIDSLSFKKPVYVDSIVELKARVTWVGNSSMEIRVDTFAEYPKDPVRELVNTAFLVYVAVDKDGNPVQVPKLIIENEFQKEEFMKGEKRQELRKQRANEGY